ncbi:DUF6228 family protein [Cellulosimicrobium cellulans]|uniref:DUF6228 family protein n=1 Tax=Cellulosimicrobium cellulans TaxID=1710 RepID=UPI0036ED07F9
MLNLPTPTGLTLEFERSDPYGPDDPYVTGMIVRAHGDHVQIDQQVILHGSEDLVDFFECMYDDFRGWAGERVWRSLEDELRVTAWHDGHVHLRWDVTNAPHEEHSWSFTLTTHHGAGEDMHRLAGAFHQLLTG